MAWVVKFFESQPGRYPVEEFIKTQDAPTIAKISHEIDLLKKHGPFLAMPHAKKIAPDLYELRVRGTVEARIIYTFRKGIIVLLHAFKKQTGRIPPKEIRTAKNRLDITFML